MIHRELYFIFLGDNNNIMNRGWCEVDHLEVVHQFLTICYPGLPTRTLYIGGIMQ